MKEFTAKQRMNNECSHNEYYGQYVNNSMIAIVSQSIGAERIKNSTNPHFNDIPLKEWDCLSESMRHYIDSKKWKRLHHTTYRDADSITGMIWSLSNGVCLAKQCARRIKESNNE